MPDSKAFALFTGDEPTMKRAKTDYGYEILTEKASGKNKTVS